MHIFSKKADLINHLKENNLDKSTVGFVPTMGALHAGHLSLLKKSIENNATTVISIFVNPTQFNNPEDLKKYPRTLESDVEKIKTISEKILIYAPTVEDIYDGNTKSQHYNFDGLENQMEGKFRPGHFDGVGTVVKRLFEIVNPSNAYFGEKDFQQLQIVKKLVEKEKLSVTIIGCPIFREQNGLAMSSRNERLSENEKKEASIIFKTLNEVKHLFGTKSAKEVAEYVTKTFLNHPIFELEYFEIADEASLLTCKRKNKKKKYRAFIAVFVNKIRLIDTISLN
ncbi:pantoate--beta-alanine ligase [Flavobacterium cheonanense]|uniref:Pantothenate synthetase n=1 Tax=Flavobacterium cheonanense TaxID=706183 RepID=A0ABP7VM26_9FLAO